MPTTRTPEETAAYAASMAKTLAGGETLLLDGPLGAGKTAFVRGLAQALGARTETTSPTFSILNVYPLAHATLKTLVHLDLYRLTRPEEIVQLGLEEWLGRKDAVVAVEWPDQAGEIAWPNAVRFTFAYADGGRTITRDP